MRLIDADKLLPLIKAQKEKETGAYTKGLNVAINIVKSIINDEIQTPTAYDADKVVEQLKLLGSDTLPSHYVGLCDAIEIVKRGGIDD